MDQGQPFKVFQEQTDAERKALVDPQNSISPFYGFVGNAAVMKRLSRLAYVALGEEDHQCKVNLAFIGPASCGKTTLARKFSDVLKIPFCELEAKSLNCTDRLFNSIKDILEDSDLDLVNYDSEESPHYVLPPMVIFIDEVHNLPNAVEQGLLKATEPKDRKLVTKLGVVVDTSRVCWIIGTTEAGQLFGPFLSRFRKLRLNLYSKEEMAKIVQVHNPDWPLNTCRLVAFYASCLPREAEDFANEVRTTAEYNQNWNWDQLVHEVAKDVGIDEHGMTLQRVSVLKALRTGPIASSRMIFMVNPRCEIEELQRDVMPPLIAMTESVPMPLVITTSKGYCLTPAGLEELTKRGIKHVGLDAIPESERDVLSNICEQFNTEIADEN
jgi:Holliday junction resolvasome RuvABC ATP-dependent DNA helicase subunit